MWHVDLEDHASIEIEDEVLSVEAASRSSVGQTIAFGERRGQQVRRIGFKGPKTSLRIFCNT